MRFTELAIRNFKEVYRDTLSLGLTIAMPACLLVILWALGRNLGESFLAPTMLAPGIAVFGFAILLMVSAMTLARDRESALLSRLFTAPLRANDFISAYSLPYIPVAIIQVVVFFAIGASLGLELYGNLGLVFLVLIVMSICCIELGMILGSLFTQNQVAGVGTGIIVFASLFGGSWMDLEAIGGVFYSLGNAFPFAHATNAARDIMMGSGFSGIANDFFWVLGYTLVFFALGIFLFRRRMLE